jgi:anti-sigma regulatory factor (Ser/Thr protein kinase)
MNVTAAFPVTEASQIGEPRRAVQRLASRLGFSEQDAGRAALVLSELATNLAKHARAGELLLGRLSTPLGEPAGLEIIAVDRGPGIPDVALSSRDGYSTTGTLGHGLGAIDRIADSMEVYTRPSGTVIAARIWLDPRAPHRSRARIEIGAVHVSKAGEPVCGDAWSWRMRDDRLTVIVADGLGHGLPAHDAATAAVDVFGRLHEESPGRLLEDVHAGLRHTRGAAVAFVAVDLERRTAAYSGLGNIASVILLPGGGRHHLVSHNGTAGHGAARIHTFSYPLPRGAVLVMASDGLGTHWDLDAYPGLRQCSASLIAATLYRDFSRRRDDVTVVVAKDRPDDAEKV